MSETFVFIHPHANPDNLLMADYSKHQAFYIEILDHMHSTRVPFLVGGGLAISFYTGIPRATKDLDIYVEARDYPKLLGFFEENGFGIEVHDVRWIAKIRKEDMYVDVIFNSVNSICRVDKVWFERAVPGELFERQVRFLSPEELLWSKAYVRNRERYDGADICHLILKKGENMDWHHVLDRLDPHWHLLLIDVLLFQFIYPGNFMTCIPKWLFEELMGRASDQYKLPAPHEMVCRGPLIDSTQYAIDVREWNYKALTIMTV